MTTLPRAGSLLLIVLALAISGCDKVDLTAPTGSSITVNAGSRIVPSGGTTEITATVTEQPGTPVPNGTTVTFSTTAGTLNPTTAQTQNGIARTTFQAGPGSGTAEIRATSGAASGGTASPATNVVTITFGTAAATTVTVRATPGSVSTSGGTIEVVALVTGAGGAAVAGVPVIFTADNGSLSATSATTDASGEARTTLTTDRATVVTATAGSASGTATVTARTGPSVTLACAVGTVTNCAAATINQPVTFTVARGTTTSNIRSAVLDFGDGTSVDLGTLSSSQTVSHTYTSSGTFTARLVATDTAGEETTATTVVQVRTGIAMSVSARLITGAPTREVEASAEVSGGSGGPTTVSYTFDFGTTGVPTTVTTTSSSARTRYSSAGVKTITVTATFSDGRTVTNSTQISLD